MKSQHALILAQAKKGWLNPMAALVSCGTMKLATRIGELKRAGHCFVDKWVDLPSGKRVKAYRWIA